MNIAEYFYLHKSRYELLPEDEVKLLFQAHFGGGHFVSSLKSAEKYLESELNSISENDFSDYPCSEPVSDKYSRLHLSKLAGVGISPKTAARVFAFSAKKATEEEKQSFIEDVGKLVDKDFAKKYLSDGARAISHSDSYRKKYSPHYRVIAKKYVPYFPLLKRIDETLTENKRLVIGIDGKAGSGKSTLAAFLKNVYDASVIEADDFFVPKREKTAERLKEIGGNIDYVRMKKEVFDHMADNKLSYTPFVCSKQCLGEPKLIDLSGVTIIEGSYSSHPYFSYKFDVSVFCDIDDELQKKRIIARNGDFSKKFFEEFIPAENAFFDKFETKKNADIVIEAKND